MTWRRGEREGGEFRSLGYITEQRAYLYMHDPAKVDVDSGDMLKAMVRSDDEFSRRKGRSVYTAPRGLRSADEARDHFYA